MSLVLVSMGRPDGETTSTTITGSMISMVSLATGSPVRTRVSGVDRLTINADRHAVSEDFARGRTRLCRFGECEPDEMLHSGVGCPLRRHGNDSASLELIALRLVHSPGDEFIGIHPHGGH